MPVEMEGEGVLDEPLKIGARVVGGIDVGAGVGRFPFMTKPIRIIFGRKPSGNGPLCQGRGIKL